MSVGNDKFLEGVNLLNGKSLIFGQKVGLLIKELEPEIVFNNNVLIIAWGELLLFGNVIKATSKYYPNEVRVKERKFENLTLEGNYNQAIFDSINLQIENYIGSPTKSIDLVNCLSLNWIDLDFEISSLYMKLSNNVRLDINSSSHNKHE